MQGERIALRPFAQPKPRPIRDAEGVGNVTRDAITMLGMLTARCQTSAYSSKMLQSTAFLDTERENKPNPEIWQGFI